MGSNIPGRKRDRWIRHFQRLTSGSPSAGAASRPTPVQPATTSPPTNDPFLQDALRVLTEKERSVIQAHVASDISTTVQAAYDAAEKQKNVCKQERWPGSDTADKVLLWLDRFKSVGDVVANFDPVHVGLPWAGIRVLLEAAVADSRQMSALINGMDLALRIANRLRAYFAYYQHLPSALTTENLRKALIALYAHLLRFLAKAIGVYSTNTAVRKAQAFWQEPDLTSFESECNTLAVQADIDANNCDRELRAKQWAVAAQWKTELAAMLQQLDSIQSIKSSLNALHVKVDMSKLFKVEEATYNSTMEAKLSRCLHGTRSQILYDITQWADKLEGKPIFWLRGQAGTGKSTISRTVAQKFDSQGFLGASFFFKRTEKNRQNADRFFSTITAQLADMIPHLQAPVAAALDQDSFLCGKGMAEQFKKLLLEPLVSIDPVYLPRRRVVVVIDALDECDRDTDILEFLRLLTQVQAESALRLCVFLTSRPELPIRLGFGQLGGDLHEAIVLEGNQEATIRGDIRAYFDNEFTKIRNEQLLRRSTNHLPADWPDEQDRQALVALAVPLFIFATTVCRFVSENPTKRLRVILDQQYSAGSSHLAKLYLPILNQLLVETEREEQQETLRDFREVVGSIVFLADPLSVKSLSKLLGLDPDEIELRLERLHSVLQVPVNSRDPVRLLHLSFRDFLINPKGRDNNEFWVSEIETHTMLARNCLRRLNDHTTLKNDICCVVQPGTRREDCSAQHISTHIPPDVAYACSYWPLHVIGSGEQLLDDGPIHRFLQQHFLHWLEAMSWLDKIYSVTDYIDDLLLLAQDTSSAEVSRFLQDAKQFVLQSDHGIDLAPLQTYHSAMIFAPLQSIVRQTFSEQVPQLWARLPKVPEKWRVGVGNLMGDDRVNAVTFSPDGQVVASASDDKTVRLWNAATGEQTQKLEGHDDCVNAVALSPDGQVIVSASDDETVRLWNAATGEQTKKLEGHNGWVNAVAFSPDGQVIVSASVDETVRLWNAATGEQTKKLEGHDSYVNAVAFSPDGQVIASGSNDKTVRLWNTATGETGEQTQKLEGHNDWVHAVAFSLDGQVIASASDDHTMRLWSAASGEMIQLIPDVDMVSTIAFSTDGKFLQTDAGIFPLQPSASALPADTSVRTTSLGLRDRWIWNQDEELLWLPHEYYGTCSAVHEQTLVIGHVSGAVSFFRLK